MLEDVFLVDNIAVDVVQTLLKADMARDTAGGVTLGLKIININKKAENLKERNRKLDPSKARSLILKGGIRSES